MAISKGLLLKVIGGLVGTAGVTGGSIVLGNQVWNGKGDLDQDSEKNKNTVGNGKEVADPTQASAKSPTIEDAGSQPQQNRDINSSKQPSEEDGSLNPSGGNPAPSTPVGKTEEEIRSPSAPTSGTGQDTETTPGTREGSEQPSGGKSVTDPASESQQKGDVNPSGEIGDDLGGAGGQPGGGSQDGDRGATQDTQREEQNSLQNGVNNTQGSDDRSGEKKQPQGDGTSIQGGSGLPSQTVTTKENSDSHSTDSSDHSEQPPRVSEPQPGQGGVSNPAGQPGAGTPSGTTTVTTTEGQKTESVNGEGGSSQQKENTPAADLTDQKASEGGGVDTGSGSSSEKVTTKDSDDSQQSHSSDQVPGSSEPQSVENGVNNPAGQAGSGGTGAPGGTTTGQEPTQHTPVPGSSTGESSNPDNGQLKSQVDNPNPSGEGSQQQAQQQSQIQEPSGSLPNSVQNTPDITTTSGKENEPSTPSTPTDSEQKTPGNGNYGTPQVQSPETGEGGLST